MFILTILQNYKRYLKEKVMFNAAEFFFGGVGEKDPKIRNSVHPFEAVQ